MGLSQDEHPYWQVFIGETYLQEPPIDPSSLTHCRQRLGKDSIEELLAVIISEVVGKK